MNEYPDTGESGETYDVEHSSTLTPHEPNYILNMKPVCFCKDCQEQCRLNEPCRCCEVDEILYREKPD